MAKRVRFGAGLASHPGGGRKLAFEALEERSMLAVADDLFAEIAPYQAAFNTALDLSANLPLVGDQLKELQQFNTILQNSLTSIQSQVQNLGTGHFQFAIPLPSLQETFTFDLGLDAFLQVSTSGGVAVAINPVLNVGFDYNVGTGAVTLDQDETNLNIGFGVSLPNFQATMSFNGLLYTKAVDAGTNFLGNLKFSLDDGGGVTADFSGEAHIKLGLSLQFADPALGVSFNPKFITTLLVDWGFGAGTNQLAVPQIKLDDFSLDADSFLQGFMKDIIVSARKYTTRLQPIIDIFDTPVPILSAFDGDETMGDLFLRGAGVTGDQKDDFDLMLKIVKAINTLQLGTSGGAVINFGDINLTGDARGAGLFNFDTSQIQSVMGQIFTIPSLDEVQETVESVAEYTGLVSTGGFKFPIYENPGPVIGAILTGQNETIVSYDTGRQHFDLAASVGVGIPGLIGIFLKAGVIFDAQLAVGYDTAGLVKFVQDPLKRPEDLLHGFYFDNSIDTGGPPIPNIANPKKSAVYLQGFAGIEANAGATFSGGLYADISIELASTDTTNRVRLDSMIQNINSGSQVFVIGGQLYAAGKISLTIPTPVGPDITLFEYELGRDQLLDFRPPPPPNFGIPHSIVDVVNLHSVMLDSAKMTLSGHVKVQPFYNVTLGNTLTYSADGIRVDYPNEIVFYVMRKNDVTTNYYNFVGLAGNVPDGVSIEVIDPFRVFAEEQAPDPAPPQTESGVLLAGGKNVAYKYTEQAGGSLANVLLVGGFGSSTLTGGTMVFGNFVPAARLDQAKQHFGNVTGFEGSVQSYITSRIDSVVAPASPAGVIGSTMTSRRGGLMFGGAGNNSFFAEGPGAYDMIGGAWTNTFTISPSFNGVPATYAIDGGPYGQSKLVVRVPADENVTFENSATVDKYNSTYKALAVTANAGLSATAHGIKTVQIIARPGASVTLGDTSELNAEFSIKGGVDLVFGGTAATDVFDIGTNGPYHGLANHYSPPRAARYSNSSATNLFGWGGISFPLADPIYYVTRTFGTNGRVQTIPFAISDATNSSIKLNAGGASDIYQLIVGLGAFIDIHIADSDTSTTNTLDLKTIEGSIFYNSLTFTDNAIELDYYTKSYLWSSQFIGSVNQPAYAYTYMTSVHYTPTISFSANVAPSIHTSFQFLNITVNRPNATLPAQLTTSGLYGFSSQIPYFGLGGINGVWDVTTTPWTSINFQTAPITFDVIANAGPFTIDRNLYHGTNLRTTNIFSNTGSLTFTGQPEWNGAVETYNILGNSGTLNINAAATFGFGIIYQTHVVNVRGNSGTINIAYSALSNIGLAGINLQVNVGASGSLAAVQGVLNVPSFNGNLGLKLDHSAGSGAVWTIDNAVTKIGNLTVNHQGSHGFEGIYEAFSGGSSQVTLFGDPSFFFRKINGVNFPSWGLYGDGQELNVVGDVVSLPTNVYGTPSGTVTYSATNLPPGLAISPTTGLITGTLTELAFVNSPYATIIRATSGSYTRGYALEWRVNSGIAIDFNAEGLLGRELTPLSAPQLSATNRFSRPVSFTVTGLPPGLSFNPATRRIVGNVALGAGQNGPYTVSIHATDGSQFANLTFVLPVTGITLNAPVVVANRDGDIINHTISASAASGAPVLVTVDGLPPGLSYNPVTKLVTGTPTNTEVYSLTYQTTIRATQGADIFTKTISWTIFPASATTTIQLDNPGNRSHPEGATGGSIEYFGSAYETYFLAPLEVTAQGLPPGVIFTFDSSFGSYSLTGSIPLGAATGSPYHVIIAATDGLSTTQVTFDWTITQLSLGSPGDFNGDNAVSLADRDFWSEHFGATSYPGIRADANGNGVVDAADYTLWRDLYTAPAVVASAAVSAITPATIPLSTTGLLAASPARRTSFTAARDAVFSDLGAPEHSRRALLQAAMLIPEPTAADYDTAFERAANDAREQPLRTTTLRRLSTPNCGHAVRTAGVK